MSDYPMLISNKLHSFRNFDLQHYQYIALHMVQHYIQVLLLKLFSSSYIFPMSLKLICNASRYSFKKQIKPFTIESAINHKKQ